MLEIQECVTAAAKVGPQRWSKMGSGTARIAGAQDSVPGDGKGGESGGDNCDLGEALLCCDFTRYASLRSPLGCRFHRIGICQCHHSATSTTVIYQRHDVHRYSAQACSSSNARGEQSCEGLSRNSRLAAHFPRRDLLLIETTINTANVRLLGRFHLNEIVLMLIGH